MKVERVVDRFEDNEWKRINYTEIKPGDKLRMFESEGDPVIHANGQHEFIVDSYAEPVSFTMSGEIVDTYMIKVRE